MLPSKSVWCPAQLSGAVDPVGLCYVWGCAGGWDITHSEAGAIDRGSDGLAPLHDLANRASAASVFAS